MFKSNQIISSICPLFISIIGPSYEEVESQLALAAQKVDFVELRLDLWLERDVSVIKHLRDIYPQISMMVTFRRSTHGGGFKGSEEDRITFIKSLLVLNPEYADIEADVSKDMIKNLQKLSPQTKWIVSWHDLTGTPDHLNELYLRMSSIPAHFYKIATKANKISDALRLLNFAKKINADESRLCALCMGEQGKCTRILSPVVGNPFMFAALSEGLESASGQLSIDTLLKTYHFQSLNRDTSLLGLIGDPIDKSRSDQTHNAVLRQLGINGVYVKFRIEADELELCLSLLKTLNLKGLSVTMPYKEQILNYIDVKDEELLSIGACNTLLSENSILKGTNTDGKGAIRVLGQNLSEKKIVIIGAGGTAKAIAYEAKCKGAHVTILNRTIAKALDVAQQIEIKGGGVGRVESIMQRWL